MRLAYHYRDKVFYRNGNTCKRFGKVSSGVGRCWAFEYGVIRIIGMVATAYIFRTLDLFKFLQIRIETSVAGQCLGEMIIRQSVGSVDSHFYIGD